MLRGDTLKLDPEDFGPDVVADAAGAPTAEDVFAPSDLEDDTTDVLHIL